MKPVIIRDNSHHLGCDAVLNGRQTHPTDLNINRHHRESNIYSKIFILFQSTLFLYIYVVKEHISHETAMCHNPWTCKFMGDREKFDPSMIDQHSGTSRFYENVRTNFCGHNIFTGGVFVTQPSGNAGISVSQIVCYNKLLFHERHVAARWLQHLLCAWRPQAEI
jgi:hypothetical protein